jgi:hypothetical protein
MPIARHWFLPLRQSDPQTYQGLTALMDYMEALAAAVGVEPAPAAQVSSATALTPPQPASFTVTGANGHFQIQVANNSVNQQPVYHEIASCTTLNFDAPGGLEVYGPEARTSWDITDPGATRYWRLRSKFLNSGFNAPQYFRAANGPGPAAVSSGVLSAAAAAPRMQRSANYVTVYGEHLAAGATLANGDVSDGTPTIDFASALVIKDGGATQITLPKTTVRGLTAGATYVVAWDTATHALRCSTDGGQLLDDALIYLGTVLLPATAGTPSSSAGGGPNGTGIATNGGQYVFV